MLQLTNVLATRENQVQLTFNEAPYLSNYLDLGDASDPRLFSVAPVSGGVGLDGQAIQGVSPMQVIAGDASNQLRVWFDRAMSHYPCRYVITIANTVKASNGDALDPGFSSFTFNANRWLFVPPSLEAHARRDIANPQSFSGLQGTLALQANLGTYVVDASGDYSYDEGLQSLKKRIYRRLVTKYNGFAHLPGYGVGLPFVLKKLGTASERARIVAEAEKQIRTEPDVLKCRVRFNQVPGAPGLFRMTILVRTRAGNDARFDFDTATTVNIPKS